jgi:hypothetical protein
MGIGDGPQGYTHTVVQVADKDPLSRGKGVNKQQINNFVTCGR